MREKRNNFFSAAHKFSFRLRWWTWRKSDRNIIGFPDEFLITFYHFSREPAWKASPWGNLKFQLAEYARHENESREMAFCGGSRRLAVGCAMRREANGDDTHEAFPRREHKTALWFRDIRTVWKWNKLFSLALTTRDHAGASISLIE